MTRRDSSPIRLAGAQLRASDPRELVWLSASAGTGKTQVLSGRVLRLLLANVKPETILCLTFTKAGAAEMADRIHTKLASWVRMKSADLAKELIALGESVRPEKVDFARTLFAKVLDAPGGGLRIQTIHAFSQTLLAGFPAEAGLSPGFRPLEGREQATLARRTLADLLVTAETGGDLGLIDDVQALSVRLGEEKTEGYLQRCAREAEAMAALGPREGILARVRTALDVPLGDIEQAIAAACNDDAFDMVALKTLAALNAKWGTGNALGRADVIARWIGAGILERAAMLSDLHLVWAKSDGEPRSFSKGQAPQDAEYADLALRMHGRCGELLALRARAELAELIAAGLRAGQAYASAYAEAKRWGGLVDFDDLIRLAVRLLQSDGMGDWVRYKLDQATDHILVDEAQDTNSRQWAIVAALAEEFFAGEGAKGSKHRTIFTVGDFKQAIFGFQGTDPVAFGAAQIYFRSKAAQVGKEVVDLSLDRSFRSAPAVLAVVDGVIETLGPRALGVPQVSSHDSAKLDLVGQVTLWHPVSHTDDEAPDEGGEEGWIDDATRTFAKRLARQIRSWIDQRLWVSGKQRPVRPEDILVLVRKRGDLASLIVARLHAEGVPVAGVDRLRLNTPLAVRDLLAAMRFAVQPEDDLTLASLLVSPLFGWSHEQLHVTAFGREGSLWRALRTDPTAEETRRQLLDLLAQADFTTPHGFLEHMLSGPLQGRSKLLARLGEEARDPIEELVNAAIGFSRDATPSLQRFLDWFDRGEVEITRDPSAPLGAVRVMTVHGSKGLQAPIVILADATADPSASRIGTFDWTMQEGSPKVPIFRPRKDEIGGSLNEAIEAVERRETEEHWRLLYVALTRAEERLMIGGALGSRARGIPPEGSWYQAVEQAMTTLGAEVEDDPQWGVARHYHGAVVARPRAEPRIRTLVPSPSPPDWLRHPAPIEARPPRPLAPSAIGLDVVADPPPGPALMEAARQGRLLHALFERLPGVAPERRQAAGERWLMRSAGVIDSELAEALVTKACAIIGDPDHADLFSEDSLAEAPVAAVVGEQVVAGTVDRLLVRADRVRVVDFKTGRRVPKDVAAIPEHHIVQMTAYVAALETVFADRPVEAALLYTSGPQLFVLPSELIASHKQSFAAQQEKL
ncbi:MAG: double-strand break repair helicase AddA [Sphingomonadaceae bacterium]